MKFNIDDYSGAKAVMRCLTMEEADIFLEYLDSVGLAWRNGQSFLSHNPWTEEMNCFNFNKRTFDSQEYYAEKGYAILDFMDFEWSLFSNSDYEVSDEMRELIMLM